MYLEFYQLTEEPFGLQPEPDRLFLGKQHKTALTVLEYGLTQRAGFVLLSGDIGSGKTTLLYKILEQYEDDLVTGLLSNTHPAFGELLQWVMLAFGLPYKGMTRIELYEQFQVFLRQQQELGQRVILIVDEAQNLSVETLEELRLLSNINVGRQQLLQIVLVGQPELRQRLRRSDMEQLAQRIVVDFFLEPLSLADVGQYIKHRLQCAGAREAIFTDTAIGAIAYYSRGIPRLINSLSNMLLVYGYAEGLSRIDADLVAVVARDRLKTGILPMAEAPESQAEKPVSLIS